jgi:hypothetical protein
MGMRMRYGGYPHPSGEITDSRIGFAVVLNQRFRIQTKVYTWRLRGKIHADGQEAINARVSEIVSAYSLNGGDAVLEMSSGSDSQLALYNAESITGVRVMSLDFPVQGGQAHYATGLPFSIVLQAEYLVNVNQLMAYEEKLSVRGTGGPIGVFQPVDVGPWIGQQVTERSIVIVNQSGMAVAPLQFPVPNPPIYPGQIINPVSDHQIDEITPELHGATHLGYGVSWNYTMTFNQYPNLGHPTIL